MRQDADTDAVFLEMSSEAIEFFRHPITAFDPFYTRDFDNFHNQWNIFLKECKRLLIDYLQLAIDTDDSTWTRYASKVLGIVHDVLGRVKGFEINSGHTLLHHTDRFGRLRLNLSLIDIIRYAK